MPTLYTLRNNELISQSVAKILLYIYIYIYIYSPIYTCLIEKNGQRKIKLIRKYENTRKKIINNECAILFNKTCRNESLLPKYIYIL